MKRFAVSGILVLTAMGYFASMRTVVPAAPATGQPAVIPLYFTGVVGANTPEGRKVLLRWYALKQLVTMKSAVIFRSSATSARVKLSVVKKIRDHDTILAIFNRPGEEAIRTDMNRTLNHIYGPDATSDEHFPARLIELLEGESGSEAGALRRMFLIQGNYGAAIVEGLGFLDKVPNAGPWTYELWQGDDAGNAVQPLGKITIDASAATQLPAPINLREVKLHARGSATEPSQANNQRIYLNWDIPPSLKQLSSVLFGFDIYRLDRALNTGETFDSVKSELHKVNNMPVLPMPSSISGEDPTQSYLFADWGEGMDGGPLLPVGAHYTYWAVPRDLLGQNGLPSNPVTVTVRDTSAPNPPKGLAVVRRNDPNGNSYLVVSWDKQTDDTVSYKLYRYLDYTHVQKTDVFPSIDGNTEGLIASYITQPSGDLAIYTDNAVSGTMGRTFWYCVSAVDQSGNESALSPPVPGAIDDLKGPVLDGSNVRICVDLANRSIGGSVALVQGVSPPPGHWKVTFQAVDSSAAYTLMKVRRYDRRTSQAVLLAPVDVQAQRDVAPVGTDELFDVTDVSQAPIYGIRLVESSGEETDEFLLGPPLNWTPNDLVQYNVSASRTVTTDCRGPESGTRVVSQNSNGTFDPIQFTMPCTDGAERVRLYRSLDCANYDLVGEFDCVSSLADLIDTYSPDGMADVCFMVQGVDHNGNLGPKLYIPTVFHFNGTIEKPTLKSVKKSGSASDPHADLVWIGPKAGISHYNVYFTEHGGPDPANPIEFSADTTSFNSSTGEWTATALRADRDLNPIDINKTYDVRVEVVTVSGGKKASNSLPFNWGALNDQTGEFYWPPRPLPPIVHHIFSVAFWDPAYNAMLVPLGAKLIVPGRQDPRQGIFPNFPFTVWRRRIDKPNQPWLNIAPLFSTINIVSGQTPYDVDDAFFVLKTTPPGVDQTYGILCYKDTASLVEQATYQYYYVQLDPKTHEILRLVGPFQGTTPQAP